MGQVRAALAEADADRWQRAISLLEAAEDRAVRRDFDGARDLLTQALEQIDRG